MTIQSGVGLLASDRTSLLPPVIAPLGSVAAGMANTYLLAASIPALLSNFDAGLAVLHSTTATIVSPNRATYLFDIHVSHTVYLPVPLAEALALHKELDDPSDFRSTRFQKPDTTPPRLTVKNRNKPLTPEDKEFIYKAQQAMPNRPLQDLAAAFGIPVSQSLG
ncbi:hypothetical protein ColTof4_14421 [Colletotrichum tofieldiae]|nr:hypothetical protein ColTof3_14859 [Colletotrichum tofieldiae]GKT81998.1 hypothetical protein ColTof4_14421 [Colletotrichum tofieldiae]